MLIAVKIFSYGAMAFIAGIFLLTLVVGVFQGFVIVLGRRDAKPTQLDAATAQQIIRDYGAATVSMAVRGIAISDVGKLPHSKDQIKQALMLAAAMTSDRAAREQLKVAYIALADWQEGVGNEIPDGMGTGATLGRGLRAPTILFIDGGRRLVEWNPTVAAEMKMLGQEFDDVLAGADCTQSKAVSAA